MNSFLKLVVRECPLDAPFLPKAPHDSSTSSGGSNGAVSASAIAGLATVLSSIFSNATNVGLTTQTNLANQQMNELNVKLGLKNLAQQKELFNQSLAYQTDMWNKQNLYNTPVAQVQRLLNAGLNPALMFGDSVPASSVGSPGIPTGSSPQAIFPMQAAHVDFSGVGSAMFQSLAMKQQMAKTDSEVNYTNAKAEYEWASMLSRLQQEANKAEYGTIEWKQAQENLKLFMETYNAQRQAIQNNALVTDKTVKKLDLDIAGKQIENKILSIDAEWRSKMNMMQWNTLKVGIKEALSRVRNNDSDSALKVAMKYVEKAKKRGLDISNEQADQLVNIVVDTAREELWNKQDERYLRPFDFNRQMQGKAAQFIPDAAGTYGASEIYERNQKRDRFKKKK